MFTTLNLPLTPWKTKLKILIIKYSTFDGLTYDTTRNSTMNEPVHPTKIGSDQKTINKNHPKEAV